MVGAILAGILFLYVFHFAVFYILLKKYLKKSLGSELDSEMKKAVSDSLNRLVELHERKTAELWAEIEELKSGFAKPFSLSDKEKAAKSILSDRTSVESTAPEIITEDVALTHDNSSGKEIEISSEHDRLSDNRNVEVATSLLSKTSEEGEDDASYNSSVSLKDDLSAEVQTTGKTDRPMTDSNMEGKNVSVPVYNADAVLSYAAAKKNNKDSVRTLKTLGKGKDGVISILSSISDLFSYALNVYNHYRDENRLPIFFMTVFGVVAVIVGFGFGLKYSFDHFITPPFRIMLGFVFSGAILFAGDRVFRKGRQFEDYGSALLGLGTVLNYLLVYFLTSYYKLVNPTAGFLAVVSVTAFSFIIALRYETRVVSVITLLGGVFAPFFLESGSSPVFYLFYLFAVVAASILLSVKISWPVLKHISFLVAVAILEFVLFSSGNGTELLGESVVIHMFGYLFFYFTLFSGRSLKEQLTSLDISIAAGNLALLLINIYEVLGNSSLLCGSLYLANGLIFAGASYLPIKTEKKKMGSLFLFLSSVFIACSVIAIVGRDYDGAVLAVESIALIFLGFLFNLPFTRREGYLLFLLSTARMLSTAPDILVHWNETLFSAGYFNIIFFTILLAVSRKIMKRNGEVQEEYEKRIVAVSAEILPITILIIHHTAVAYYFYDLFSVLSVVPMAAALHFGCRRNLKYLPILAFGHILFLFAEVVHSINVVSSFHYSDQILYGKIAIAEILIIFWLTQLFFEKLFPESIYSKIAVRMRDVFYIILPLTLLSPIKKFAPEYLPTGLWGSFFITFILYDLLRKKYLEVEIWIVGFFAAIVGCLDFGFNWKLHFPSFFGSFAGVLLLLALFIFKKGYERKTFRNSEYKKLFTAFFYYGALFLLLLLEKISGEWSIAFAGTFFYLLALVYFRRKIFAIRSTCHICYGIVKIGMIPIFFGILFEKSGIGTIMYLFLTLLFITPLFIDTAVYKKIKGVKSSILQTIHRFDMHLFHIFVAGSYLLIINYLTGSITGPYTSVALMSHGVGMIYQAMNKKYGYMNKFAAVTFLILLGKLYLKDLRTFSLIEKVLSFTVIGLALLTAAYVFQKLKARSTGK